jgi:Tetratricopeptide repeat
MRAQEAQQVRTPLKPVSGVVQALCTVAALACLAMTGPITGIAAAETVSLQAKKEALFQQMLREPANLDVILAYAEVSAELGDNEAAVSAFERLLLFNPNLPRANLELGALYFRMGSFEMARTYFEKAIAGNPSPEVRARIDQYLSRIATEESPARLTGYLLMGGQYQSDANVAPGSPVINSLVGPLLLSSQSVKKRDENLFITGSALYSHDLGTPNRDTFEVTGTGFAQHYFRVQRLEIDLGELTAGPRFRFPDTGIPGVQSASLKPYAIVNEVGLGRNQYFYTVGNGLEGTATFWQDALAKFDFEFRHKAFTNAPDRPQSTGLDGDDKLVALAVAKPVTPNSALSLELDYLRQDTSLHFYSNDSYGGSASYTFRYDDPTGLFGRPWETTLLGGRFWSHYAEPDFFLSASPRYDRRWRLGLSQVFQVSDNLGVVLQLQRDIVSSNIPLYAYTSNSVLIGPVLRFDSAPGLLLPSLFGPGAPLEPGLPPPFDLSRAPGYRLEGGVGIAFGSNHGQGTIRSGSLTVETNDVPLAGDGLAANAAVWIDGPLAAWTGNQALANFSFGLEYRHYGNSESSNVTAMVPLAGGSATVGGSVTGTFRSENLIFDAAWRLNSGLIHPYLGLGGGVGYIDWRGRLNAPALALLSSTTPTTFSTGVVSAVPVGHTFVGLDYDVAPNIYIGAGGDFYFADSIDKRFTHTRIRMNTDQFSLLAHAGVRF